MRNQKIGIKMQELVAVNIERMLSKKYPERYMTRSNGTREIDVSIIDLDLGKLVARCEVKTAKEFIPHVSNGSKSIRRGMFNIKSHDINNDIFAFVVRFVDIDKENYKTYWNGDYEIFYSNGNKVSDYLEEQTLNCKNWKFCIDKLPFVHATHEFIDIFEEVMNIEKSVL